MSTSIADHGRRSIRNITQTVAMAVDEPRATLGWTLGRLGNNLARLGQRLDPGVPTVDGYDEEFQAGYRAGQREGSRVMVEALRLGYAAGKAKR